MARGVYRLIDQREEHARSVGGGYLNAVCRGDRGWTILRQQMNYDTDTTPALWNGQRAMLEAMPTAGTLLARLGFSTRDVGVAGGPSAWSPDAHVALPGAGWVNGPRRIRRSLRDGSPWQPDVVMHDLETLHLDGGLAIDIGWYDLSRAGRQAHWGTYTLVARRVPSADWQVHWLVTTASP